MTHIFVNLKRFDVPKSYGGICPSDNPATWIEEVVRETVRSGVASRSTVEIVYFLPEGLLLPAATAAQTADPQQRANLHLGSQGVFREDVQPNGNFGAFTTNLPAAAARTLGAEWTMIGHSEEREDKYGVINAYDATVSTDSSARNRAREAIDQLLNTETHRAVEAGLDVLFCVGETSEEQAHVEATLEGQVRRGLAGVATLPRDRRLAVGYEPIWAIGPGKTPPRPDYIGFAAETIKRTAREALGLEIPVVYGGGLRQANAGEIGAVSEVDGGLVALTRFTDPIGFDPGDLVKIIDIYLAGAGKSGEGEAE